MGDDLVQRLRESAIEIASAGHYGWGNACTYAADEIERLTREDECKAREIERLRACLKYEEHRFATQSTHSKDCHTFGPRHYECALREIDRIHESALPRGVFLALERACGADRVAIHHFNGRPHACGTARGGRQSYRSGGKEMNTRELEVMDALALAARRSLEWIEDRDLACKEDCGNPTCRTNALRSSVAAYDALRAERSAEKCFCDEKYPDSNRAATCGDCPRDYKGSASCEGSERRPIADKVVERMCQEHNCNSVLDERACSSGMRAALEWYESAPTPPAVANGEPTAEQWRQAVQECPIAVYSLGQPKEWIEQQARELARSAAAKGEG